MRDFKKIVEGIKSFTTSFVELDESKLKPESLEVWRREKEQLTTILKRLSAVKDINAARSEFALLSEQVLVLVKRFGTEGTNVFELHCPMAFDGRGATWLQQNDKPSNPYFAGAFMESCADKVKKIASDAKNSKAGHRHE